MARKAGGLGVVAFALAIILTVVCCPMPGVRSAGSCCEGSKYLTVMDWLPLLAGETTGISTDGGVTATTSTSDDNPFQPVLDFFDSATFEAILKLIGFMVVVLWLASAFFVFRMRGAGSPTPR